MLEPLTAIWLALGRVSSFLEPLTETVPQVPVKVSLLEEPFRATSRPAQSMILTWEESAIVRVPPLPPLVGEVVEVVGEPALLGPG